ncbi:hypothetical protein [Lapidilactobacillus gannanensis]|uniref:Uncharacterized protein n=1 Tax=Lapidilactobacillus gannanensis TaxID=2486002 RepID=A0ABW4BK87_9LACO|nr:hypothetical protein [Lapidilactobacillus gannanensis]
MKTQLNRKFERVLIRVLGGWQIADGLITILIYGTYLKLNGSTHGLKLDPRVSQAISALFGSLYTFSVMFGVLLIGLGIFNLYLAKTWFKDSYVSYKWPIYLLILGILAYFCMDIISVALAIVAGVVALSKNKALKNKKDGAKKCQNWNIHNHNLDEKIGSL